MTKRFPPWALFLLGMVCGVIALAFYIAHKKSGATQVIFPDKYSFDNGDDRTGFVSVRGTLAGEGVDYPNNVIQIWCYKSKMQCSALHLEQIGDNQIGDIDEPILLSISRWDPSLIVATDSNATMSGYPLECIKTTLNIERSKDGAAGEWIEEPINSTHPLCKNTPTTLRKWTLKNPPYWFR